MQENQEPKLYRKPWTNPGRLDLPVVMRLVGWQIARPDRPYMSYPSLDMAAQGYLWGGANILAHCCREQVIALYRVGAVWLKPKRCINVTEGHYSAPAAKLTAEALEHPDVTEAMWRAGPVPKSGEVWGAMPFTTSSPHYGTTA